MNETIMSFLDSYDPNTEKVESAFDTWLRDHKSEVYLMMDTCNLDFDNASLRCYMEYKRGER